MKAENKLVILNGFIQMFENEIDMENNMGFFEEIKKSLTKEIIINKYDSPVYISKSGTTMLLKNQDSIEIGQYIVAGPEAVVVDAGLSNLDAIALGEKVVLNELKSIVGFKESDYTTIDSNIVPVVNTINKKKEDSAKINIFSCACKDLVGLENMGEICPKCQTRVIKELPKIESTVEVIESEIVEDVNENKEVTKGTDSSPSSGNQSKQEKKAQEELENVTKIVDSIIGASNDTIVYKNDKPVDENGVIIDDEKEDYYAIKILTDDNTFISPDVDDYNNRYTELMDTNNPVFIIGGGTYTHVRGYNTVDEVERLSAAEEKRQEELLGITNESTVDNVDDVFEEKTATVNIFGNKSKKLGLKAANGISGTNANIVDDKTPKFKFNLKNNSSSDTTTEDVVIIPKENKGVTFGRVRTVSDILPQ